MDAFVLTVWLTAGSAEATMLVPTCRVGREWYQQAVLWAERSGIDPSGPGWLCVRLSDSKQLWRVKR